MLTDMLKIDLQKILELAAANKVDRLVVGYSGGLDSQVLLHWLHQNLKTSSVDREKALEETLQLAAVHIHHGLSDQADAWQRHCQNYCDGEGIPIEVFHVQVSRQGSLEENARFARYSQLSTFLKSTDLLLLAHHRDDQIETSLFHLFRGNGFSGMPSSRRLGKANLYRPLLTISKEEIKAYAASQKLSWIEDESNQNTDFDRNYIRLELLPMLRDRWEDLDYRLSSLVEREREQRQWMTELARENLNLLGVNLDDSMVGESLAHENHSDQSISLNEFYKLPVVQQKNALSYWLAQKTSHYPSDNFLNEAVRQMKSNSFELQWKGFSIRGYRGRAYLDKPDGFSTAKSGHTIDRITPAKSAQPLSLSKFIEQEGSGLRLEKAIAHGVRGDKLSQLSVRFRAGSEQMKISSNQPRKKLKNLFQESGLPPWMREHIPLIFEKDQLVALPAIPEIDFPGLISAEIEVGGGGQGWLPVWEQFPNE